MNYAFAADALKVGVNVSAWDAILSASLIVQATLIILLFMSVVSWAIIFTKRSSLNSVSDLDNEFEEAFWRADSLDDIFAALKDFRGSAMANIFKAGYLELRKLADSSGDNEAAEANPKLKGIDNLERSLIRALDKELAQLEGRLSFLATTGSTGPFIGLFGTVWGIMGAFQKIGTTGMASLAVVAPGISEALIATAVGLAAAIPASIAYNHYINRIRKFEVSLNGFVGDFVNIAKRNFFKES